MDTILRAALNVLDAVEVVACTAAEPGPRAAARALGDRWREELRTACEVDRVALMAGPSLDPSSEPARAAYLAYLRVEEARAWRWIREAPEAAFSIIDAVDTYRYAVSAAIHSEEIGT